MSDLTVEEWHAQFTRQARWTRAVRNQLYRRVNLLRAERVLDVDAIFAFLKANFW